MKKLYLFTRSSIFIIFPLFILSACTDSSKISMINTATYTITSYASLLRGGLVEAKSLALSQAAKHCSDLGFPILVVKNKNVHMHNFIYSGATIELDFGCYVKKEKINETAP